MVTAAQGGHGRRRHRIVTQWRLVMDEIEWKQLYNEAADTVTRITAPETKEALALILHLVHQVNDRLTEYLDSLDDE